MGCVRVAIFAVIVTAMLLVAPAAAGPPPLPAGRTVYRAPVPGPVIDPYRPPSTPYGPGNRGIDFATTPGEAVAAAADGEVTFAGAVGGGLHVVVLHADGIRTSLSFLAAVLVRRGQRVAVGQPVGRAGATLHFGARRGEAYLDPASLLSGAATGGRALLVPDGPGRPLGVGDEAAGLRRLLAGDQVATARPATPPAAIPVAARSGSEMEVALRAAALGTPPAWAVLMAVSARHRGRRRRGPAATPAGPRSRE